MREVDKVAVGAADTDGTQDDVPTARLSAATQTTEATAGEETQRTSNGRKFDAFLSYGHAQDGAVAKALQDWLELVDKPVFRGRARRIFRDEATLAMSEDLWGSLQDKLDRATFLLILASPASANSRWVAREIAYFLQAHGRTRVGIAISSGKNPWNPGEWEAGKPVVNHPSCAVSSEVYALFGGSENPPLFVDIRPLRELAEASGRSWVRLLKPFARGIPKRAIGVATSIVAAIEGRDKDELFGSHLSRERSIRTGLILAAILFLGLASWALWQRHLAVLAENQAVAAANEAKLRLYRSQIEAGRASLMESRPLNAAVYLSEAYNSKPRGSEPFQPTLRFLLGRAMRSVDASEAVFESGAPVNVAALNADASLAVTGDAKGRVCVWQTATQRRVRQWTAHQGELWSLLISPDGKLLATGGTDKVAKIWDLESAKLMATLGGHASTVGAIAFDSTGARLATATGQYLADDSNERDPNVRVWDVSTGKLIQVFRLPAPPTSAADNAAPVQQVTGIAFSPDGSKLAAVGDGAFALWDAKTAKPITISFDDADERPVVAFHPNSKVLVVAGSTRFKDGKAEPSGPWVRDANTGKSVLNLDVTGGLRSVLAFDKTGESFATTGPDNDATIWRIGREQVAKVVLKGHAMAVTDIAFARGGAQAVTSSMDRRVRVWDTRTGILLSTFEGHDDTVEQVQVSLDSRHILSAGRDDSARLWDGTRTELGFIRTAINDNILGAEFSPDGTRVLTVPFKGPARLWDVVSGSPICDLPLDPSGANDQSLGVVAFSKSSLGPPLVASWRADGEVNLWSGLDCALIRVIDRTQPRSEEAPDRHLIFDAGSTRLLGAGVPNAALIWSVAGGLVARLDHGGPITSVDLSADARLAVTAGKSGEVKLWRVSEGKPPIVLRAHEKDIMDARFGPKGDLVVTLGDDDHNAKLWDAQSGTLQGTLPLRGPGYTSAFSQDGALLTIATSDGRASVWDVARRQLVASVDDLQGIVMANAFLGGTHFVVSSTIEGQARVWDGASGAALVDMKVPNSKLVLAQPSPRGDFVALPTPTGNSGLLLLMAPREARGPDDVRRLVECRGRRHLENERPVPFDVKNRCRNVQ